MKQLIPVVLVGVLFQATAIADPDTPKISITMDRSDIQIADPFSIEIELTAKQGSRVSFPPVGNSFGAFEVLNHTDRFELPVDGNSELRNWTRTLELETLETGKLELPTIEVTVEQPREQATIVRSDLQSVVVQSSVEPTADLTKFEDIANLRDARISEANSWNWGWIASSVLGFAGLVVAGIVFLTRKPKAVCPKEWALEQLNQHSNIDVGEVDQTLRGYLQEKLDFPATSYSPSEVMNELEDQRFPNELLNDLSSFLDQSTKVRFGGQPLSDSEGERLRESAKNLVSKIEQQVAS